MNAPKPRHTWTTEQTALLRQQYADVPGHLIAQALGMTLAAVYRKANSLGLKKSKALVAEMQRQVLLRSDHPCRRTRIQPGNVPWNKGVQGSCGHHPNSQAHHYTKGQINGRAAQLVLPLGTLRIGSDGLLQRKVTTTPGAPHKRWHPVHRTVWEAAHGPVPKGHLVVFKPGQRTSELELITLDRLELISRADNARRNSIHRVQPPELRHTLQLRGALTRLINRKAKEAAQP